MSNQVLWTIDNEIDGGKFERLCVDLLYRNGFRDIVPKEPQDGGRDAEESPRRGRGRDGEAAFFQFSMEHDWRVKLRRDVRKLSNRGFNFSTLVFVTNQKARGVDIDTIAAELRQAHGWNLIVYSREWLRLQLEEANPDLAKKYLNIDVPAGSEHLVARIRFGKPPDERLSAAWAAMEAGAYERAVVELKEYLDGRPESANAWQALSWSQYCCHRYDEALASINRATKLKENQQALSIRACILAEKGINERSRSTVLAARQLFEQLMESTQPHTWQLLYNLGNVSSAIGEHQKSISYYRRALALEEREPMIWKNLASSYHMVSDHRAEMECFDKALELDPLKPETLVSKGVSLLVDFEKPEEAATLLECALKFNPDLAVCWPHIWYWLGEAHRKSGSLEKALHRVEDGLAHQPSNVALKGLMSDILKELLAKSDDVVNTARRFWKDQLLEEPLNYGTRRRLARLEWQEKNEDVAWALLEECFGLIHVYPVLPLRKSPFSIEECDTALEFLPLYAAYRKQCPIDDYWNPQDPLYDLPFQPPASDHIKGAINAFLAIPFGLAMDHLENTTSNLNSKESLIAFFDFLRPHIERAVTTAARELSDLIPSKGQGAENVANKITEIIMFIGLLALREFARQRGWIATQFNVLSETMNSALDDYDEARIEANVITASVLTLNEKAQFVK